VLADAAAGLNGHGADAGIARVLALLETRLEASVAL